jgi:hypothetical protein
MSQKQISTIALVMILMLITVAVDAQCPMCRMTAESNLKDGGSVGLGLNAGILYMLCTPYILVAAIGIWWYRNKKKEQVIEQAPSEI